MYSKQVDIGAATSVPPDNSALDSILRRISGVQDAILAISAIADRACGDRPPNVQAKPAAVPNGLLDRIDVGLEELTETVEITLNRLRRIA